MQRTVIMRIKITKVLENDKVYYNVSYRWWFFWITVRESGSVQRFRLLDLFGYYPPKKFLHIAECYAYFGDYALPNFGRYWD